MGEENGGAESSCLVMPPKPYMEPGPAMIGPQVSSVARRSAVAGREARFMGSGSRSDGQEKSAVAVRRSGGWSQFVTKEQA